VSYMLAKETVSKRLETGISYTEFSYMILQSIDWLHLYQNHNVKIQFGGSDQWGNLTAGLDLMRKVIGKNDAVALSSPLLLKSDGEKFGKSESGTIWLDPNLTTPYELYQYFLNTSDDDILTYFKLLTTLEKEEIENILNESNLNKELRLAQKRLAEEVVVFVHGKKAYNTAIKVTDSLFSGDFSKLSEIDFKTLERVLDNKEINKDTNLIEIVKDTHLASSNREAREFIKNGAISVNGEVIKDFNYQMNESLLYNKYIILRRGKKKYALGILVK
ncbi:MAG: tyrosine--tRNA ligase, partial [Acholeplasmataceae bacterium]